MKFIVNLLRPRRGAPAERSAIPSTTGGDDTIGRGMDLALTIAVFLVVGIVLDAWLGTAPLLTIVLLMIGSIGSFVQLRYAYEERMQRHEAARDAQRSAGVAGSHVEETA